MVMTSRRRDDSGAAAVEFALILPIVLTILFGILQYGLYFNDALGASQGTRAAVRQGIVASSESGVTSTTQLKEMTKDSIGALTGPTYVKVIPPDPWSRGEPLTVCAMVQSNALHFLPLPNDGWIKQHIQMSVEQDSSTSLGGIVSDDPPGQSWNDWCPS